MISKRIKNLALFMSLIMVLGVFASCGFTTNGTSKRHRDDDDDDRYEYDDDDEDEDEDDDNDKDRDDRNSSGWGDSDTNQKGRETEAETETELETDIVIVTEPEASNGYWELVDTKIIKAEPHNAVPDYQTTYGADEYIHSYSDFLPDNGYHADQSCEFTATCSEVPGRIDPGVTYVYHVSLSMSDGADYLFTATAAMYFDGPYDPTKTVFGTSGIKFLPTDDNAPNYCSMDTCGNEYVESIEVYRVFDPGDEKGDLMCYSVYGCESSTVWIYRWVE